MSRIIPGIPEFVRGEPVSLEEVARAADVARRAEQATGLGGPALSHAGTYPNHPWIRFGTWARLTAFTSPYYSWKEVYPDENGYLLDRLDGLAGTSNAKEENGLRCRTDADAPLHLGEVVWMVLGEAPDDGAVPWTFRGRSISAFWAQITGPAISGDYPWVEWDESTMAAMAGGRSSTSEGLPARDIRGFVSDDLTGKVVWLRLARDGTFYVFDWEQHLLLEDMKTGTGISNVYHFVDKIQVDQAYGLLVSLISTGTVRLTGLSASVTQMGMVDLNAGQVLGTGYKRFNSCLEVNSGQGTGSGAMANVVFLVTRGSGTWFIKCLLTSPHNKVLVGTAGESPVTDLEVTGDGSFGGDLGVTGNAVVVGNVTTTAGTVTGNTVVATTGFTCNGFAGVSGTLGDGSTVTGGIVTNIGGGGGGSGITWSTAPMSSSGPGSSGDVAMDSTYFYGYTGGRWQRVAWDTSVW